MTDNPYLKTPLMDWLHERADASLAGMKFKEAIDEIGRRDRDINRLREQLDRIGAGALLIYDAPTRKLVLDLISFACRDKAVYQPKDGLTGCPDCGNVMPLHRSGCKRAKRDKK
jgi:hypothetical protein